VPGGKNVNLKSNQLGDIEIQEDQVVNFPLGIPGFEDHHQFAIFALDESSPFFYMHSVSDADLCLVLGVPFVFFPDYELELGEDGQDILGVEKSDEEMAVFVVLTIPEDFKETTANLVAPVVVNPTTRTGIQYVQGNSSYQIRNRIFSSEGQGK